MEQRPLPIPIRGGGEWLSEGAEADGLTQEVLGHLEVAEAHRGEYRPP